MTTKTCTTWGRGVFVAVATLVALDLLLVATMWGHLKGQDIALAAVTHFAIAVQAVPIALALRST